MEFHRQKKPDYPRIVQIKEVGRLVRQSLLLVVLMVLAYWGFREFYQETPSGLIILALIVVLPWTISKLFWLRANWRGVVVDFQKGILSFPGGGIILKHMTDIFKPSYIFQRYLKFDVPLSQIRMVVPREKNTDPGERNRIIEQVVNRSDMEDRKSRARVRRVGDCYCNCYERRIVPLELARNQWGVRCG